MTKIRPWLFIGRHRDVLNQAGLQLAGIGAMLLLAEDVRVPGIDTLFLDVEDDAPLSAEHLQRGIEFAVAAQASGRNVLIACGAGMNRSAVFTAAVMAELEEVSVIDALVALKRLHPDTMPNRKVWESVNAHYGLGVPYLEMVKRLNALDM